MPEEELDGFGRDVDDLFGDGGAGEEAPRAPSRPPQPVRPPQFDTSSVTGSWFDTAKEKMGGMFFKTLLNVVVLLLIVVGAAHALYSYLFPGSPAAPGPAVASVATRGVDPAPALDSQPPVAEPVVAAPPSVPDEQGDFVIQIGLCVYPSCVSDFQQRLRQHNLQTVVTEVSTTWQSTEVYSQTVFQTRDQANVLVGRINGARMMDEQAYVRADSNEFRISMGNFDNPTRANTVTDRLNLFLQGEADFTTRVWEFPQKMHSIVAGHFTSRREAEATLNQLVQSDTVFAQSYVVRQ